MSLLSVLFEALLCTVWFRNSNPLILLIQEAWEGPPPGRGKGGALEWSCCVAVSGTQCYHWCDGKCVIMFCVCVISGFGVGELWFGALGTPTLTTADFTSKLRCNVTDALTGRGTCSGCSRPLSIAWISSQSFQHFRELGSTQSYRAGTLPELALKGGN